MADFPRHDFPRPWYTPSPDDPPPLEGPLSSLGWKGTFKHDDAEVVALRSELEARAGVPGMENDIIDPAEEGYAEKAAAAFKRDGFVIIKDVRACPPPAPPHPTPPHPTTRRAGAGGRAARDPARRRREGHPPHARLRRRPGQPPRREPRIPPMYDSRRSAFFRR